jgi:hypothetical protein
MWHMGRSCCGGVIRGGCAGYGLLSGHGCQCHRSMEGFGPRGAPGFKVQEVVRTVRALVRWLCAPTSTVCRLSQKRLRHGLERECGGWLAG